MRFGISATSLMCPKNLRTRLRPVNVCCAIGASHFVALQGGASSGEQPPSRPGCECRSFRRRKARLAGHKSPEFVLQTFKTQNDVRGADAHPPVRTILVTDCKSPKSPVSQQLTKANAASSALETVLSCCRPDMG